MAMERRVVLRYPEEMHERIEQVKDRLNRHPATIGEVATSGVIRMLIERGLAAVEAEEGRDNE